MPYYHSAHFDLKSLTIDNTHTKNTSEGMQRRLLGIKLFCCRFERDLTGNNCTRPSCRQRKVTLAEFRVQFWSLFRERGQLVLSNSVVWTTAVSSTLVSCDVRTQCEWLRKWHNLTFCNELQKDFPQIRCISGKVNEIRTIASSIDK